jgi:hypothetical protein
MAERVFVEGPSGGEPVALTRRDAERLRDRLDVLDSARNLGDVIRGLSIRIAADEEEGPLRVPPDREVASELLLAVNQLVGGLPSDELSALARVLQDYLDATKENLR